MVSTQVCTLHRNEAIFQDSKRYIPITSNIRLYLEMLYMLMVYLSTRRLEPRRWESPTHEMKDAYMPSVAPPGVSRRLLPKHSSIISLIVNHFSRV